MQATFGIMSSKQASIEYDTDAQAFFTAAGITDDTQKSAVNTLVLAAKANSWWTLCYAIYPFVGGDATKHSYNLKNPSLYQLTFGGGWTHSSTGSLPNGTTGYADTGINCSTVFTLNDTHISTYLRNDTAASDSKTDFGVFDVGSVGSDGIQFLARSAGGNVISDMYNLGGAVRVIETNANSDGYYSCVKNGAGNHNVYKNGSFVNSNPFNGGALVNFNLFISGRNDDGTASSFSDREVALFTVGTGMNGTLAGTMYTDIQTFQTSLSRNV